MRMQDNGLTNYTSLLGAVAIKLGNVEPVNGGDSWARNLEVIAAPGHADARITIHADTAEALLLPGEMWDAQDAGDNFKGPHRCPKCDRVAVDQYCACGEQLAPF